MPFWKRTVVARVAAALLLACGAARADSRGAGARESRANDVFELSIEELLEVDVTTVSRQDEALRTAPAAVCVISSEDIERSGAQSIPEVLRMVPGLHVARMDASKWAISARGFNGRFARHLLVLMDGRTVYSPLFSGTFWELQDTFLPDIERIEVIRGPGGTMWGANAVNAVINIITKSAADTQGGRVQLGAGAERRASGGARYGGMLGEDTFYRLYAKGFEIDDSAGTTIPTDDDWRMARAGFRIDWLPSTGDSLTFQGDVYDGETGQTMIESPPFPNTFPDVDQAVDVSGGNLLARWEREALDGHGFALQMYYDYTTRDEYLIEEERHTGDVDFQHRLRLGPRHGVMWGAGFRVTRDNLRDSPGGNPLALEDEDRTDRLYSLFVQDDIGVLSDTLDLTLGSKFEHNDYTGWEIQPNVRLSYVPSERQSFWAAVSRAVRTPARLENESTLATVFKQPDGTPFQVALSSDDSFDSEVLWAYELGHRARLSNRLSLDTAVFYHDYDRFQSVDLVGPAMVPPPPAGSPGNPVIGKVGNELYGETYGIETTAHLQAQPWWRIVASYSFARVMLHVNKGVKDVTSEALFEDDYPRHQASLRSMMDLGRGVQFDTWLRFVDEIKTAEQDHRFDEILELDVRLQWRATDSLSLELIGRNLIDDQHEEYGSSAIYRTATTAVERSIYAQATWVF